MSPIFYTIACCMVCGAYIRFVYLAPSFEFGFRLRCGYWLVHSMHKQSYRILIAVHFIHSSTERNQQAQQIHYREKRNINTGTNYPKMCAIVSFFVSSDLSRRTHIFDMNRARSWNIITARFVRFHFSDVALLGLIHHCWKLCLSSFILAKNSLGLALSLISDWCILCFVPKNKQFNSPKWNTKKPSSLLTK